MASRRHVRPARVVRSAADLSSWCRAYRAAGLSLGFVPTLGALHDGHAALLRAARRECERVAVSIYLNPTQFNSAADLEMYPVSLDRDVDLCAREGVDLVLLGAREDFLPGDFETRVEVASLTRALCGAFRPGHFQGVATVVTQLLSVVRPHRAYFGEKDYQQARVVSRLVRDLMLGVEIRTVPTVRDVDGLALSSRNVRLSPAERRAAPVIYRALDEARNLVKRGERRVAELVRSVEAAIASEDSIELEYVEVLEARNLRPFSGGVLPEGCESVLIAVAARAGATRLIDNVVVGEEPAERSS